MKTQELVDHFISHLNNLSNIIQCGENLIKLMQEDKDLVELSGPELWELSSKKFSFEQIIFDVGIIEEEIENYR